MKISEFAHMINFELVVEADAERSVGSVYCADLLSWAMGRAPAESAWCTIMGNVNAVAVASLADVAIIVLCEGALLDAEAELKANQQGINIVKTNLPAFEAGLAIAARAELYGQAPENQ